MSADATLRVELTASATVHWSTNGWQTVEDMARRETGLGPHIADLEIANTVPETAIVFTFYWMDSSHWEGADFAVQVKAPSYARPE